VSVGLDFPAYSDDSPCTIVPHYTVCSELALEMGFSTIHFVPWHLSGCFAILSCYFLVGTGTGSSAWILRMTFSLLPPRQHVWEVCTHGTALSISTCMALAWSHLTDNTCYKGGFVAWWLIVGISCLFSLDSVWTHLHGRCAWYAPPYPGARRYPVLTATLASICVFLRCSVNPLALASYS
jgi:hypothetical protein